MHKHHGRHNDPTHHAHILMYGRSAHAEGGSAPGNMASNIPTYRHGGKTHRKHHAEGDAVGTNPITGMKSPDVIERRKGGRACHAEGDTVAVPYRGGGKTHHKRRHHADGEMAEMKADGGEAALLRRGGGTHQRRRRASEGGMQTLWERMKQPLVRNSAPFRPMRLGKGPQIPDGPGSEMEKRLNTPMFLRKGGETHRRHHAKGEMAELMSHGGCKKKSLGREKHDFGDIVGNLLPLLPLFLKEGGEATKLAAGGAGKMRKGMLTKAGKILKAPIHSPMHMPFKPR